MPSLRNRILYYFGVILVRGTVAGVAGMIVGALTWAGVVLGQSPVASAAAAGSICALLAMVAGVLVERYLPHSPVEMP